MTFTTCLNLEDTHSTGRDWKFYREAGETILWPHLDVEYQHELQGIADGVKDRGIKLDLWDIVAINGSIELSEYYVPWLDKKTQCREAGKGRGSRQLQCLHCDWQLYERRQDCHRA